LRVLKSKSLILDVYGAFVRGLGGWIAVSHLIELMGALGSDEQVVRSSVSRFMRKGLLARRRVGDAIGYELTDSALSILTEGDDRIYNRLEPGRIEDGWTLATFSIPEENRARRHQLRSRLNWLGFGSLGGGAWIAPRRMLEDTQSMVEELGLERYVDIFEAQYTAFADLSDLVHRCWDIPALRKTYQEYIDEMAPVIDEYENVEADDVRHKAFADYVYAIHEWRKLPFVDPGLPPDLLPDDWEGRAGAALFNRFRRELEPAARRYVIDVVRG